MTNTYIVFIKQPSTERIRTLSGNPRNVLWNWYAKILRFSLPSTDKAPRNNYSALQTEEHKFWHLQILGNGSSSNYNNISPGDIWNVSGTIPEPFRKIYQIFDSGYNTEYIRIFLILWGYFLYSDTFPTHITHAKDGYSSWIQTTTKFQMRRSLYKYTIKLLLVSPMENWGITAIMTTSSRPRFLKTFLKSRLKWRTASRWTRNRKLFFATPELTGARLFFLFPGLDADRLQQGRPSFSCAATYSTSPTSTTSEIRTVVRGALSPTADEATVSALNQRSRVSFIAFLRDKIFSRHDFKSTITGPASTPIAPQGSNLAQFRTASAVVTAVFSMLIPVSEKKIHCVNEGWRTKSCTHAFAPLTWSWSIATPSSETVKMGCTSERPFTTNAVNGKT